MADVIRGDFEYMVAKIKYRAGVTSRKIANNTTARLADIDVEGRQDGVVIVRLHNTDIITIHQDNSLTLSANGWLTPTTKQRMNEFLHCINWAIWQDRGAWFLHRVPMMPNEDWKVDCVKFADGVHLFADGDVTGAGVDTAAADRKRKAQIKKFCADYFKAFATGDVPFVSAGDCFYCQMRDVATNKPMPDTDHLESHFEESYFVPGLLTNAWDDTARHSGIMGDCLAHWQDGTIADHLKAHPSWTSIGLRDLQKMLYVYLCKQFGLIAR